MRLVPQIQEPFSFHLIPTKGCLLLCSALPLVSIRTRNEGSREGRSSCQAQAEKKNLSLFVCLVFCGVNLSTADQRVVQQSVVFSQRKRTRGKREVNKNKQLLLSPATSGETGLYRTHKHACIRVCTFIATENR